MTVTKPLRNPWPFSPLKLVKITHRSEERRGEGWGKTEESRCTGVSGWGGCVPSLGQQMPKMPQLLLSGWRTDREKGWTITMRLPVLQAEVKTCPSFVERKEPWRKWNNSESNFVRPPHDGSSQATVSSNSLKGQGSVLLLSYLRWWWPEGAEQPCMRHFHNENILNPVIPAPSSPLGLLSVPNSP